MRIKRIVLAVMLALIACFTLTAGSCEKNSPSTPTEPVAPGGGGDSNDDCDSLGEILGGDSDCDIG